MSTLQLSVLSKQSIDLLVKSKHMFTPADIDVGVAG